MGIVTRFPRAVGRVENLILVFHAFHSPWKSLRDSHIPNRPTTKRMEKCKAKTRLPTFSRLDDSFSISNKKDSDVPDPRTTAIGSVTFFSEAIRRKKRLTPNISYSLEVCLRGKEQLVAAFRALADRRLWTIVIAASMKRLSRAESNGKEKCPLVSSGRFFSSSTK